MALPFGCCTTCGVWACTMHGEMIAPSTITQTPLPAMPLDAPTAPLATAESWGYDRFPPHERLITHYCTAPDWLRVHSPTSWPSRAHINTALLENEFVLVEPACLHLTSTPNSTYGQASWRPRLHRGKIDIPHDIDVDQVTGLLDGVR